MKILVMGANGMLGHAACRVLGTRHEIFATCRASADHYPGLAQCLPERHKLIAFEAGDDVGLDEILAASRPAVVLNCIGIVKQKKDAHAAIPSILVNALFPHQLAQACDRHGARLIQVSTDCVFSGRRGLSTEDDIPDPVDLYGRSKLLGEVARPPHLTIRTSIIGRELGALAGIPTTGLLEWFLAQRGGQVHGYAKAVFSGLTTGALAGVIAQVIEHGGGLEGLYNVASSPISKYDLLSRIDAAFGTDVRIERDESFVCDRSLDGARFAAHTGIVVPSWDVMIEGLTAEQSYYEKLKEC